MAKLFFFLSVSAMVFHVSYSQNLDSLRVLHKSARIKDTAYIINTAELAYQLYSRQPDTSLALAKEADSLSLKLKFQKGEGRSKRVIGIYFFTKGDFDQALPYFENALTLSEKSRDQKNIASCLTNIGVVYRKKGNTRLASDYFFKSLKIRESINDKQGIATTANNLGLVYTNQRLYDKALEYFDYSGVTQKEINDLAGLSRTYLNRGRVFQLQYRYEEAISSFRLSLKIAREIGDEREIALTCDNMASSYISLKLPAKAIEVLPDGLRAANELKAKDLIADIKETYAEYYNAIGNWTQANVLSIEAISLARESGVLEIWRDALWQKHLSAKNLGNYQDVFNSYYEYILLRDSIKNEELTRETLAKEFNFRTEKIKLEHEKRELELAASNEKQKRATNAFAGVAFTLVVISIVILVSYRKIKYQKSKIESINKKLVDLDREKSNLMSIVAHDLKAPLNNIKGLIGLLKISMTFTSDGEQYLHHMEKSVQQGNQLIRDLLDIHAFEHESSGLEVHEVDVDKIVAQWQQSVQGTLSQKQQTLLTRLKIQDLKIKTDANKLTRIIDNLLSNASKFSTFGKNIYLNISEHGEMVNFAIKDEGPGLTNEDQKKLFKRFQKLSARPTAGESSTGLGLSIISVLATKLKGVITVNSVVGQGTEFVVSIPKEIS